MTTNEVESKARSMREAGASYGSIAKELGMSKSKAYRITKDIKGGTAASGEAPGESKGYLDAEARFAQLLSDYAIKDAHRVVSYASTQGEDVYSSIETLKRCLVDQGVAPGKIGAIIRHWGAQEGLPVPPRLVAELGPEAPSAKHSDRWSLIGKQPIRDPDGQYSFLQALQLLQASGSGDDDTKSLLAGIYKKLTEGEGSGLADLRDEVRQLREDRTKAEMGVVMTSLQAVRAELTAIKNEERSKSEYDIMGQGLAVLDRRLGSIESGVMARWSIPPRPLPPGAKRELTQAISEESVEAQALDELAQQVFYGQPPGPPKQVVAQPPTSYE